MLGVVVVATASCGQQLGVSGIGQVTFHILRWEKHIAVQVIVAHKANVLNVVAYAVVSECQPHVEPAERPVIELGGGLNIGRDFGFAVLEVRPEKY